MFHGVDSEVDDSGALRAAMRHAGHVLAKRAFVEDAIANIIFVKYYALAAAVLLYSDYVITLPDEIRRIWGARFTGATVLFLLNRYVPMVGYMVILTSLFHPPWTTSGCNMFAPFPGALNTFSQGVIMIILLLRTYALYERKLWVLVLTTSVGLVNIGVGAWAASAMTGELFTFKPIQSCVPILQVPKLDRLRFAWVSTFAFDFLIFCLTIKRTYCVMRKQSNRRMDSSLALLVMRDGSLFFLVMAVVNALNFVLFMNLTNAFFSSTTGSNSLIAHVVSVSLMNRLMLNLRRESDHYHEEQAETNDMTLTNGNLFSTRIVGNLTSELILNGDNRDELDAYYGSRVSAPSAVLPNLSNDSQPASSAVPSRVTWGDGSASSSKARARPNAIASGSRLRESTTASPGDCERHSPATVVNEYPLRTFANKRPTSPLSNETCVGSYDLESIGSSKRPAHQDIEDDWQDVGSSMGKGKQAETLQLDRRFDSTNDLHEMHSRHGNDDYTEGPS